MNLLVTTRYKLYVAFERGSQLWGKSLVDRNPSDIIENKKWLDLYCQTRLYQSFGIL